MVGGVFERRRMAAAGAELAHFLLHICLLFFLSCRLNSHFMVLVPARGTFAGVAAVSSPHLP